MVVVVVAASVALVVVAIVLAQSCSRSQDKSNYPITKKILRY